MELQKEKNNEKLNSAERHAADLVAQAVNIDVQTDLNMRLKLLQLDLSVILEEARQAIAKVIVLHNVPVRTQMHLNVEVDGNGIASEVTRKTRAFLKGESVDADDILEMY